MRFALPCAMALLSLVLSCPPATAAQFSHPDKGFGLTLPDQWTENAPRDNVFIYHLAGRPHNEPPLLVVRIQPFADAEDAKRAAALGAQLAARPQQALEDAASVRLRSFTAIKEDLDPDTGALNLTYSCAMAFYDHDITGSARAIPSTKGLFLVGAMVAEGDAESATTLDKAVADMEVEGQALIQGASTTARIMEVLQGRGLMLLLSLGLTCLSLFAFFRFFRRDKTARTLIRHEREKKRLNAKKSEEPAADQR